MNCVDGYVVLVPKKKVGVYKSRAHRDSVNKKVMKDKRLAAMCDPKNLPFDAKCMFWGGFKQLVTA